MRFVAFGLCALSLASLACNDKLAVGAGAALTWSPPSYNFPDVVSGTYAEKVLTLKNTGSRALQLKAVRLVNASAVFTLSAGALTAARTLNPNATYPVTVRYTSQGTSNATAILRAETDAGNADAQVSNLPPAPRIELTPATIDFGIVSQGDSRTRDITVRNIGTSPLTLARVAPSSTTSAEFAVDLNGTALPATLDVLQERVVKIRFTPSAPGVRTGAIEFTSDDPTHGVTRVNLASGGGTAQISVDPMELDFGAVEQGQTKVLAVHITNTGTVDLHVTPSRTGSTDFQVATAPLTVAPNATMDLNVTYAPSDAGTDDGTLVLTSDAPGAPVQVTLTGGAEPSLGLSPIGVQFTNVVQFQSAEVEVVLTNKGYGVLVLGSIAFGTGSNESHPDFSLASVPQSGTMLGRGQSARFTVRYSKTTLANPTGVIYIASNDPDPSQNPFMLYVLAKDGVGIPAPTPVIDCSNCNGTTLQGTPPLEVRLDGTRSIAASGQTLTYSWALLSLPAGSQAVLDNAVSATPRFTADVAGTYRVGLVVRDGTGQLSPRTTRDISIVR